MSLADSFNVEGTKAEIGLDYATMQASSATSSFPPVGDLNAGPGIPIPRGHGQEREMPLRKQLAGKNILKSQSFDWVGSFKYTANLLLLTAEYTSLARHAFAVYSARFTRCTLRTICRSL